MTAAPELTLRQVPLASIERADWDRLLSATAAATPFARWTFHRAWWDAYGETAAEHYLVAAGAGDDGDAPRAIVPLMRRTAGDTDPSVIFFGASYHADYATILAAASDMPLVANALADSLGDRILAHRRPAPAAPDRPGTGRPRPRSALREGRLARVARDRGRLPGGDRAELGLG